MADFTKLLELIDESLGLELTALNDIDSTSKELIAKRQEARDQKDWTHSDSLRDDLTQQNIGIDDTAQGSRWYWL